jgi:hypothetical protein
MAYKLSATVADEATSGPTPTIYLSTFGVWVGDSEVCTHECPGIFGKIREIFKRLEDNKKGQRKPMTLSWFPSSEHKRLFQDSKNKKLRITVFIEQSDGAAKWALGFAGVKLMEDPKKETKIFKDKTKRQAERINTTFMKFYDDPS